MVLVLFAFYIQSVLKFKCKILVPRGGAEKRLEIGRGSTRWHCVENLLWKRLWTCYKTDCMKVELTAEFDVIYRLLF